MDLQFVGALANNDFEQTKSMTFIVSRISNEESYKKLKNVETSYSAEHMPIYTHMDGCRIVVRFKKILGKFGPEMLKIPRKDWLHKLFKIDIIINKYQFKSQQKINKGEIIKGYNFMLKHIDLYI
jgi:hypothetical protein